MSWKVELGQRFGLDIPVQATLVSLKQQTEERTVVDLDWISINIPLSFSHDCVRRLSQKFAVELDSEEVP